MLKRAKRNENSIFLVREASERNKDSIKIWARNHLGYIFGSLYLHSVVVLRMCIKFEFKSNGLVHFVERVSKPGSSQACHCSLLLVIYTVKKDLTR